MKTKENNIDRLEALLRSKPWDALSEDERTLAATEFESEGAYNSMRDHLLSMDTAMLTDMPALEPDSAILSRLENTMALKPKATAKQRQVHKQSVLGALASFFTMEALGVKATMAAVLVAASIWSTDGGTGQHSSFPADSASFYVDSSGLDHHDTSYVKPILFIH